MSTHFIKLTSLLPIPFQKNLEYKIFLFQMLWYEYHPCTERQRPFTV